MSRHMLRDALTNSVKELYSSEQQQLRVLPTLVDAATTVRSAAR